MFILRLAIAFIPACMPPLRQCPATHWYRRVPWNITVPTPGHIFALNCLLHVPTLVSLLETDLYQETAITSLLKTHPTVSLTLCSPRSMLFRVQQTQQREMLASVTRIGLHHLAALLSIRFDYRGNAEDLDQATPLVLQRHAHHGPYSHSCEKYYKCIALLGIWLEMEIGITGCEQDGVDNASLYTQPEDILIFELYRVALAFCPPGHPGRSTTLNKLAISLHDRWRQRGSLSDLDEAIKLHRAALALLRTGFAECTAPSDMDEAIEFHRAALVLCPPDHPG
ncbi:hypothetical protein EV702DRAFT_1197041 [Suillus placidus]|uniref:Fructose-bisphosphate aldolase n=1 Tax=Suillus placidus TaxID=48579 RepID=A0A9P6ZW87_9AGAM|nr:hypothetical protein EV702DRAFT_1197041 [Suillus placidus]